MEKRKNFDWEYIEREFVAGQLSIMEIARQAGCSRQAISKRAARQGWSRDLTGQVNKKIKATLLAGNETDGHKPRDEALARARVDQALDIAARRGVAVIRDHQALISSLIKQVQDVITRLGSPELTPRERTDYLRVAAQAAHRLIPLERIAFSLDDPGVLNGPQNIQINFNREEISGVESGPRTITLNSACKVSK
ncbi:MAG: hypothetical protein PF495_09750 [Spirochaetales bacterium]|jgi:hypothetical protein|nr:hypothetical protein [Spirochaetales bacterium]